MYVYSGTCPLNFYCILLQVFDTSPKLNVSLMLLSVTQNNCWLQRATYRVQSSTQKYRTPSKLQNEIKKKIVVVLRCKMFLFEKIDKNVQFNSVSRKFLKLLETFVSA